jgi:hypothetical protein
MLKNNIIKDSYHQLPNHQMNNPPGTEDSAETSKSAFVPAHSIGRKSTQIMLEMYFANL